VHVESHLDTCLHLPLCSLLDMPPETRWRFAVELPRGG
jgi:hypothetical protein